MDTQRRIVIDVQTKETDNQKVEGRTRKE